MKLSDDMSDHFLSGGHNRENTFSQSLDRSVKKQHTLSPLSAFWPRVSEPSWNPRLPLWFPWIHPSSVCDTSLSASSSPFQSLRWSDCSSHPGEARSPFLPHSSPPSRLVLLCHTEALVEGREMSKTLNNWCSKQTNIGVHKRSSPLSTSCLHLLDHSVSCCA